MKAFARFTATAGAVLALCACAGQEPITASDPTMIQAQPVAPAAPPPLVLQPNPVQAEKISSDPRVVMRQAMKDSSRTPADCAYEGSRMTCPWFDGHIYTMYVKQGEISTIYLSPDESMRHHYFSKDDFFEAKPDWVGSVDGERDVLVVQAWLAGKTSKLTITTTRREYQIMLVTNRHDYNPSLKFIYPDMQTGMAAPPERDIPVDPTTKIPLSRLNIRYSASGQIGELRGDQLQVMDDGKKTYVVFPEAAAIRPPYFAKSEGHGNNVEMSTDESGNYIIHGVYRESELQIGNEIIRIKRGR